MVFKNIIADNYSDVPILIHIGPHKSGTTWLQKRIFAKAKGVIYDPRVELSHNAFLIPRIEDFSAEEARHIFAPILAQARKEKKPIVISDEALGGRPFGQRFLREVAAERIARTFPHAHILITTREQDSIILSMYSEYLRYGYSSSLHAFLCQETGNPNLLPLLDLCYYEWDRFLKIYETHFQTEKILMIPMEWGLKSEKNYLMSIESFLGAPLEISSDLRIREVERGALSAWALGALRHVNKMFPQDSRYLNKYSRINPNSIGYQIDRFTPAFSRRVGKQEMRKIVRDHIGDRFSASNRRFQSRVSFCLKELSYRVGPSV